MRSKELQIFFYKREIVEKYIYKDVFWNKNDLKSATFFYTQLSHVVFHVSKYKR